MSELIPGEVPIWYTDGATSNPTSSVVLADTGAIATLGTYLARVAISTDAAGAINVQLRNAANNDNSKEMRRYLAANANLDFIWPFRVDTANQRLRVIPNATITGNLSASIDLEKLA